ncbi:MAG TPA: hypothetical protein P5032_13925 [Candidatus Competibacter sp.]|nr:hypothetical protein [Candidatus Competibacteraceae bacterium]HRW66813.1 hypothetical protein [Candidatus Competibacter sp.]
MIKARQHAGFFIAQVVDFAQKQWDIPRDIARLLVTRKTGEVTAVTHVFMIKINKVTL